MARVKFQQINGTVEIGIKSPETNNRQGSKQRDDNIDAEEKIDGSGEAVDQEECNIEKLLWDCK